MKLITALIITFITIAIRAFAQTELPMLTSQGAFQAYAIQQAAESQAWAYSSGGSSTIDVRRTWTPGQGSSILIEKSKFELKFETVSPDSEVQTQLTVMNKDGDIVLDGYTQKKPERVNGVWTMPKSAGDIKLRPAYILWIKLDKPVNQAWIVARDKAGNESFYDLAVRGQYIGFARDSAGLKNAYVRANFADTGNSSSSWTIETGVQRQSVPLSVSLDPKLENFHSFKNMTAANGKPATVMVPSNRGVGIVPTIEMTMDVVSTAYVDVTTSEGKRPIRYRILSPSGKWTTTTGLSFNNGAIFPVEQGISYIVPEWKVEEFSEVANPVSTGGSKG